LEVAESPRGEYIVEWNVAGESFLVGITSMKMKESLDVLTSVPGITMDKAINLFDTGYNTIESLKAASQEDFALVEGITKLDAKRVYDHFHKGEPTSPKLPTSPPASAQEEEASTSKYRQPEEVSKTTFRDTLCQLPGMSPEAADALLDAGFVSAEGIRDSSVDDLVKVNGVTEAMASAMMESLMKESLKKPPEEATSAPKTEAAPVRDLERSFSYLVEEDKPETSYDLFISALKKGIKGYCITRNYPAKIRSKFDLKDVPIVWLSNVGRDNAIRPKDLEKLSLSLEQFLSQPDGGIVLLDGLEYLITNNNFITVLRLIQSLRDQVAINQSILLIAVNRSTLESHQLNLLEREVDHTFTG
jgi:predicted flap endonuclease-1-like 5' DNA nuclease